MSLDVKSGIDYYNQLVNTFNKTPRPCLVCNELVPVVEIDSVYTPAPHLSCADKMADAIKRSEARDELEKKLRHLDERRSTETERFNADCKPPRDWREKTFDTISTTDGNSNAVYAASSWLQDDPFGLLMTGPCGTGKTHIAWAIVNKIINDAEAQHQHIRYPRVISCAELFQLVRRNDFKIPSFLESGWIVCIDDLGAENITDWSREVFLMILDRIQKSNTRLIITTNLNMNEIRTKLGDRISSRILELCVPIKTAGDDYRVNYTKKFGKELFARFKSVDQTDY